MELCPYLFCLSFCLLYFFLPPFEDNGLFFWVPDVLCRHSEVVLWNLLRVQMFFWWICEVESFLPLLFLHHLRTASYLHFLKRQNDRILKEELPRSVGAQYATGDQWRNNSRKTDGMEPKQKEYPAVGVTGDRSKVRCCKEQYCIGTWNVRSMNQGKLEVVKQEMVRVKVDI